MRLESPIALILLVFLPLIWRGRSFSQAVDGFSFSALFPLNNRPLSLRLIVQAALLPLVRVAVFTLLVLALARPQAESRFVETEASGRDIMLTLDLSGSMEAMDFFVNDKRVTRLDALKRVVDKFIDERQGDRIGLVVFGEQVFTQCPLSLDHEALKRFVDALEIGMAGGATSVADAVAISLKRLKDLDADSKVVVLVTDGKDNSSKISGTEAAQIAKELGIKIHAIGLGGKGYAPMPEKTIFGTTLVNQMVDYDEAALRELADTTGGQYFNAKNMEGLEKVYEQINQLEVRSEKTETYIEYEEWFLLLLTPAVVLFVIYELLIATFYLRIP